MGACTGSPAEYPIRSFGDLAVGLSWERTCCSNFNLHILVLCLSVKQHVSRLDVILCKPKMSRCLRCTHVAQAPSELFCSRPDRVVEHGQFRHHDGRLQKLVHQISFLTTRNSANALGVLVQMGCKCNLCKDTMLLVSRPTPSVSLKNSCSATHSCTRWPS